MRKLRFREIKWLTSLRSPLKILTWLNPCSYNRPIVKKLLHIRFLWQICIIRNHCKKKHLDLTVLDSIYSSPWNTKFFLLVWLKWIKWGPFFGVISSILLTFFSPQHLKWLTMLSQLWWIEGSWMWIARERSWQETRKTRARELNFSGLILVGLTRWPVSKLLDSLELATKGLWYLWQDKAVG